MTMIGGHRARGALLVVGLLASTPALAATQTGTLRVIALTPTNILNVDPLDFGLIIPGAAAGTVTLNAQTGARTGTVVTLAGATFSRARFVAAGTPNRVVTLAVNPSPTITISNGVNSMTINQLRVSANGAGPQPFGPNHTLNSIGVIDFRIGGRLNVGANQPSGLYTGSFTLTMDYQ
jgi:Domain of unknown function (DUF4402)